MKISRRLREKPRGLRRLGDLSPEILGIIFDLCSEDLHDLCNMSLVSRGMYLFTVPYLYREIKLNLVRASHIRLLQRLAGPECRLAEKIRTVAMADPEKQHTIPWESLYILFMRLKYLRDFYWNGPMGMPYFLLEIIASRYPQARLNIAVWKPLPNTTWSLGHVNGYVLTHRVGLQINAFIYRYDGVQRLNANFKGNLLTFLAKKDTLSVLAIFNKNYADVNSLPEMLEHFRNSSFPCMKQLVLHTTIFTTRELSMWALKGKWDRLDLLHLHNIHQLHQFIGRTPRLQHLSFHFDYRIDMDQTEYQLATMWMRSPLHGLRSVAYSGQGRHTPFSLSSTRRVAPWFILETNPGITKLELTREFECPYGPVRVYMPTASEIRRIRTLCPNIGVLELNINICGGLASMNATFRELAQFQRPIELSLHLRLWHDHNKRYSDYCRMCKQIFTRIVKQRKFLGLPYKFPFQIHFGALRMDRDSREELVHSECTVQLNKSGKMVLSGCGTGEKERLDKLSVDELRDNIKEQSLLERYRDRKGYKRELQRRERSSDTVRFPDDFTLYNIWA